MYFKWIVMFFAELLMFTDFQTKKITRSKKYGKPHIPLRVWNPLHHLLELPNWVLSMVICVWHIEPPTAPVPALAHVEGLKNFITKLHSHKTTGGQFGGIKPKIQDFLLTTGGFQPSVFHLLKKKQQRLLVLELFFSLEAVHSWDVFFYKIWGSQTWLKLLWRHLRHLQNCSFCAARILVKITISPFTSSINIHHQPSSITRKILRSSILHILHISSSWWFQPIWNILVKLDHLPK